MNLLNLRIGQRLSLGFGFIIAVFLIMAAVSFLRIRDLGTVVSGLTGETAMKMQLANRAKTEIGEASRAMMSTLVMTDDGQIKSELERVAANRTAHAKTVAELEHLVADEAGQTLLKDMAATQAKLLPAEQAFVSLMKEGDKDQALMKYLFAVRAQQNKYSGLLDRFVQAQQDQMDAAGTASRQQADQTGLLILALACAATLASVVIGVLATRSITLPINSAVAVARKVASGDLSSHIEVRSRDETGALQAALSEMNESLRRIVGNVREGTESIAAASSEIASGNMDLSNRTEQQASALEQTSSSMRELTSTVRRNADNAMQANQLAASASEVAGQGGDVVSRVVHTMQDIDASSRKIVDIISVIDGIAFQTNILALNAAVEAARAGEQGRGFAVVAGEVRTLAQRSASAAKEIKSLIGASVDKVAEGSKLVAQAGTTMEQVVASVRRVTDIMGEITAASHAQSEGIEQVNHTIHQMDASTQQNAALVEQAAAAATSMRSQATSLEQVVSQFKLESAGH
jgi:methyl-accepting chemotaxis protein